MASEDLENSTQIHMDYFYCNIFVLIGAFK